MAPVAYCRQRIARDDFESFSISELQMVLQTIKSGTAAGYDNSLPRFLKHLGPMEIMWLTAFFTRVVLEKKVPRTWRQAKVIAIPKPGKDLQLAAS